MDQPRPPRHHSFVGPIILIVLGGLLLFWNVYDLNPWPILFRYWPLILILIGLGKIWDSYYIHRHMEQGAPLATPVISGMGIWCFSFWQCGMAEEDGTTVAGTSPGRGMGELLPMNRMTHKRSSCRERHRRIWISRYRRGNLRWRAAPAT